MMRKPTPSVVQIQQWCVRCHHPHPAPQGHSGAVWGGLCAGPCAVCRHRAGVGWHFIHFLHNIIGIWEQSTSKRLAAAFPRVGWILSQCLIHVWERSLCNSALLQQQKLDVPVSQTHRGSAISTSRVSLGLSPRCHYLMFVCSGWE